jgi:hypothetical protein
MEAAFSPKVDTQPEVYLVRSSGDYDLKCVCLITNLFVTVWCESWPVRDWLSRFVYEGGICMTMTIVETHCYAALTYNRINTTLGSQSKNGIRRNIGLGSNYCNRDLSDVARITYLEKQCSKNSLPFESC